MTTPSGPLPRPAGSPPAVVEAASSLSYAELDVRASATARRLAALDVGAGDRVATTLRAGIEFAVLLHALPRLGAVLVPIGERLTPAERRWQIEESGARLLVEEPPGGAEADVDLRPEPDPAAPHTLLYTSGTTARPKPVLLTWSNFRASALASAWNLGVDPAERWLCCLPVHHAGGLSILIRSALYRTTAVVHPGFDEERVLAALSAGEATLVSLVATMVRRLAAAGLERPPRLRAALVGGGPVPREVLEWGAARGVPLVQTYGMTETASQIATASVADALDVPGAAGRPLPGVEVRVDGRREILVRGPMVAAGARAPDGWLHTGDLGRLDADGLLWVEGRLADVIVTGGENVSAQEVEEALTGHPAVLDAGVSGRPDPEWGEAVVAFVVLARDVGEEELIEFCRGRIASFKVPKAVRRLEELPRSAGGKLLRRRLPA